MWSGSSPEPTGPFLRISSDLSLLPGVSCQRNSVEVRTMSGNRLPLLIATVSVPVLTSTFQGPSVFFKGGGSSSSRETTLVPRRRRSCTFISVYVHCPTPPPPFYEPGVDYQNESLYSYSRTDPQTIPLRFTSQTLLSPPLLPHLLSATSHPLLYVFSSRPLNRRTN